MAKKDTNGAPADGGAIEAAAAEAAALEAAEAAFQARVQERFSQAGGALTRAEAEECQRTQDAHDVQQAALAAYKTGK